MNFYEIETGQQGGPDYVFLKDLPTGAEGDCYRMSRGLAMGAAYPANAILQMTDDSRGTELPSVIGNVDTLLIVHRDLKDVFASTGVPMECLPFTLMNQKKRVASRDYFIVNPLGWFDCIDFKASEIVYAKSEPTVIIDVERLVLDGKKLEQAPDFFRIAQQRERYVVSERLGQKLAALKPTNVTVVPLEQSQGA